MEVKAKKHKLATEKITVPVGHISPNQWNPNKMDSYTYEKMKKTIEEKGLFGSIIVRYIAGEYEIIDGEHRYRACVELGYKEIPVENAGEMTDQEVKFWTMYFNNTRGKDDVIARAKLLNEMDRGQASLLPWTEEELANHRKLVDWSPETFNEQKEAKPKPDNLIHFQVTEATARAWKHCLEVASANSLNEEQLLITMIDHYLSVFEGRSKDDVSMKI